MLTVAAASAAAGSWVDEALASERQSSCAQLCLDACAGYVRDGRCDDGAGGACARGTDCTDCGTRRVCDAAAATPPDVCVATIMSSDRVRALHRLAGSWLGWLSVGYLSDDFARDRRAGAALLHLDGVAPARPERIRLTLVRDEGYRRPHNRFPFNLMRNAALRQCPTTYALLIDVDFVLSSRAALGPDGVLDAMRRLAAELARRPGAAYVLPAFEVLDAAPATATATATAAATAAAAANDSEVVRSKADLRRLVRGGRAISFAQQQYASGHKCDDAPRWLRTRKTCAAVPPRLAASRRLTSTAVTPTAAATRHAHRHRLYRYRFEYSFGCEPYAARNSGAIRRNYSETPPPLQVRPPRPAPLASLRRIVRRLRQGPRVVHVRARRAPRGVRGAAGDFRDPLHDRDARRQEGVRPLARRLDGGRDVLARLPISRQAGVSVRHDQLRAGRDRPPGAPAVRLRGRGRRGSVLRLGSGGALRRPLPPRSAHVQRHRRRAARAHAADARRVAP